MENEQRRRRPARRPSGQNTKKPVQNRMRSAEVVYIPPEPVNRKKMTLRLLTVAAVALALFLGFSIFFRVENIVISGNEKYTAWAVQEASGIQQGDSLLAFGKAKAAGRITKALPYVKSVRIGITLPNRVNIYIEELEVVYAAEDSDGQWWLLTSDGRVVDKTSESSAQKHTMLLGFQLDKPVIGKQALAAEADPDATEPEDLTDPTENSNAATEATAGQNDETQETVTDATGMTETRPPEGDHEESVIIITNKERLETALSIVTQLERNEILGEAASVDVTDMGAIELWYGKRYRVELGAPNRIEKKIATLKAAISEMGGYQSGVLDLTFKTFPDGVGYEPFQ